MKTRKLFAILTLVAFMMTLLPMAAFAAEASKAASKISVGDDSKSVGSTVEVTVALRDSNNAVADSLGGKTLYIWAERTSDSLSDADTVDEIKTTTATVVYGGEGQNFVAFSDVPDGTVKVKFTSGVSGEVTFKAALADLDDINNVVGEDEYYIGSRDFEWKQLGADKIVLSDIDGVDFDNDVEEEKEGVYNVTGLYADGEEYELTFVVTDKNGNPLSGEKVEFSLNKTGAHLNKTEATTDILGEVDVKVYAYDADDYRLSVKKGSKITVVNLDFGGSNEPFDIELSDEVKDKVAIDTAPTIEFKLYDVFGNRILEEGLEDFLATNELDQEDDVMFSKKPSASDLEDEDISVVVDGNVLSVDFDKEPDVAGTYEVKVKLPNGKFATCSFEAAEQDEITRMVLDIKESYLAYGSTTGSIKVKYYDDDNVFYEDKDLSTVDLSVSNSSLAKVTNDNKIEAREAGYNDFNSGKVVVTAIDTARNLVATDEITVGSLVAGVEVNVPEEATLAGETATITYQLVNQNGEPIAFDADKKSNIDVDAYIISKPDGAEVDIDLPLESDYRNSLSRTGKIDVDVTSDTPGTVTVALVIEGEIDNGETITLSTSADAKFVAERVAMGAENVTLFIGSTGYVVDGVAQNSDLAPFIKDNRTFVPVRVVGEALGADVEWDAATQTVTLVREDKTITLTIGSNELTISDGTVVVADVAPFIESGRTVLPFRAIAEAFGADVEAIFGADGSVIAVQFEQ